MQMQKLVTFFFSKNIGIYAIFNDPSFNDTLSNDIVSFEQLVVYTNHRSNAVVLVLLPLCEAL